MTQTVEFPVVVVDRYMPVIDLVRVDDWSMLQSTRLAALRDSPDAFVATVATEAGRTREEWMASIRSSTWVIARDGDEAVGIACRSGAVSVPWQDRFIESVWVTPLCRRQRLVRKMLCRLEEEARAEKAEYLQLWVLETNDQAYDAYLKLGFHPVPDSLQDSWKVQADGKVVRERLMLKPLL